MQRNPSLFLMLILTLWIAPSLNLDVTLNPNINRCLVAYTDDPYQTLKLDIQLPQFPGQTSGQGYSIQIYNTETHQSLYENMGYGRYRKQIDLDQNAIYKICIKLMTNRQMDPVTIDYNSDIQYMENSQNIKIPQNLLKGEETATAYENIMKIEQTIERYQEFVQRKKQQENNNYMQTIKVTERLSSLSYIEIGIVVIAGVYQFFTIRKFLVEKQMI